MFLIATRWDGSNALDKFLEFDSQAEAEAALPGAQANWPNAFVVEFPSGRPDGWIVDAQAETLSAPAAPTSAEKAAGRHVSAVQFYLALSAAMVAKGHTLTVTEPVRWELVKIFQALPSAVLSDAAKGVVVSVLTDANTFHRDDPNPATGAGNALNDMGALLAYVGGDPANPEPAKAFTPAEIDALFVSILGL